MKKLGLTGLALAMLAAGCESATEPAAEALAPGVQPALDGLELSTRNQEFRDLALQALQNGTPPGAIIDTEVGCFVLIGFFNGPDLAAFGLLFGEAGTLGDCGPGSFNRTNPDGSLGQFRSARENLFLTVVDPEVAFPSVGSDVIWQKIVLDGGVSVLQISGRLGDGSRVRAHFLTDPNGQNNSSELWIEGLGYVVY